MDSEMRNAVRAAENSAQYDERAKRLLSQIIVNVEAQQKIRKNIRF
jgi:hypothetical protein